MVFDQLGHGCADDPAGGEAIIGLELADFILEFVGDRTDKMNGVLPSFSVLEDVVFVKGDQAIFDDVLDHIVASLFR